MHPGRGAGAHRDRHPGHDHRAGSRRGDHDGRPLVAVRDHAAVAGQHQARGPAADTGGGHPLGGMGAVEDVHRRSRRRTTSCRSGQRGTCRSAAAGHDAGAHPGSGRGPRPRAGRRPVRPRRPRPWRRIPRDRTGRSFSSRPRPARGRAQRPSGRAADGQRACPRPARPGLHVGAVVRHPASPLGSRTHGLTRGPAAVSGFLACRLLRGLKCTRGGVRELRYAPGGGQPVLRGLRCPAGGVSVVR